MSDYSSEEDLPTVRLPEKFVDHWTIEAMRLHLLMEVLFRSLCYADTGDKSSARGDDVLVRYISDSLDRLWIEIEEVSDGHWEPRSWEEKADE
jgi:hypothetical protein